MKSAILFFIILVGIVLAQSVKAPTGLQQVPPLTNSRIIVRSLPVPGSKADLKFQTYVVPQPTIYGVQQPYDWKDIEPSNGVYDFTKMDADIALYAAKSKKTVIVISLITDQVGDGVTPNTSTPQWALAITPMISCDHVPLPGIPIVYDSKTIALTQPFILKVLRHLDGNIWVAYVRIGFWKGGENCPECKAALKVQTALDYNQLMSDFIKTNHPNGTGKTFFVSNCSGCFGNKYTDGSAAIFVGDGLGIGTESVFAQDYLNYIAGQQCGGSDWCNIFNTYPTAFKYLQPGVPQDLDGLLTYYPFIQKFGTNYMELRYSDVSVAYNPTDLDYPLWGQMYRNALIY